MNKKTEEIKLAVLIKVGKKTGQIALTPEQKQIIIDLIVEMRGGEITIVKNDNLDLD